MQSLLILGRQPALGLAEVESLYGPKKISRVGSKAAIVDVDPCLLAFDRLGGSVKFVKLLTELPTTDWSKIEKFLLETAPGHAERLPDGKLFLGLSAIDFDLQPRQLQATGLKIKKAIRPRRPVRLIPNNDGPELNAAQVIHNKLTGPHGWELLFIKNKSSTLVAQTVKVQDIASYTKRDRGRPKRDTKVGMLPPKLAQIIINLAAGKLPESVLQNICEIPAGQAIPPPILNQTVLDPFCGTGVILQEAMLMGYDAVGTDLDQRMCDYSLANMEWLKTWRQIPNNWRVEQADATKNDWSNLPTIDFVATETFLGTALNSLPDQQTLAEIISNSDSIIKKFLQNIHSQLKPGTRLCLAVPAWQIRPNQFRHLPLIDSLSEIGYNQVKFEHASDDDLIYYRSDQTVARKLLVITRK